MLRCLMDNLEVGRNDWRPSLILKVNVYPRRTLDLWITEYRKNFSASAFSNIKKSFRSSNAMGIFFCDFRVKLR